MPEPNQREVTEAIAWRLANQFLLAEQSGRELSRLQIEIRAAIQSAVDHEREACAKVAEACAYQYGEDAGCSVVAAAIRKRNEQ